MGAALLPDHHDGGCAARGLRAPGSHRRRRSHSPLPALFWKASRRVVPSISMGSLAVQPLLSARTSCGQRARHHDILIRPSAAAFSYLISVQGPGGSIAGRSARCSSLPSTCAAVLLVHIGVFKDAQLELGNQDPAAGVGEALLVHALHQLPGGTHARAAQDVRAGVGGPHKVQAPVGLDQARCSPARRGAGRSSPAAD